MYDQTMLESIESILIPNWRKYLLLIKDLNYPKSILSLIDENKLSAINTSTVKTSMKQANFQPKYICSIQNFKHEISSKKSRQKYNNNLSGMRNQRDELMREKEELKSEINAYIRIESSLIHLFSEIDPDIC